MSIKHCQAAAVVLLVALGCLAVAVADEDSHTYTDGEAVVVWGTQVGPYHNPQETYSYHSLPLCKPDAELEPRSKWGGFSGLLHGSEFANSDLSVRFKETVNAAAVCTIESLDPKDCERLSFAVSNHYWYQLYVDDLPVWGMIGESSAAAGLSMLEHEGVHDIAEEVFVYTHKQFSIAYNGDQIIEVNLTSEAPAALDEGVKLEFTYGVRWVETSKRFDERFNRYLDSNFFEHQIHAFSLINAFCLVAFLTGLVALILMRTLNQDYDKYLREELEDQSFAANDETGWKLVHGDVFRRPAHLQLLSALLGTGFQLVLAAGGVIVIALLGSLYVDRGKITSAAAVCYAVTSFAAGYKSGSHYRAYFFPNKAPGWKTTMLMTAGLLPAFVASVLFLLNLVSLWKGTSNSIPFTTVLLVIAIWTFVSLPLVAVGTVLGRVRGGAAAPPCRVNNLPRTIPPRRWFSQPWAVAIVTGILPFGSIFIEMYFVFTSFWNYKFYYVYGFMFLVYVILFMVCSCVTIVATYFMLNAEDYRWPWSSFAASGSTAVYVFIYSLYYFVHKTNMTGFLQTSFYFGYTFLFCTALFVLCGTIGNMAASAFVHRIYRNIKVD